MESNWVQRFIGLIAIALVLFLVWWLWPPNSNPNRVTVDYGSSGKIVDVLANDTDLFHRPIFIKKWSNGSNGGKVALAPSGRELIYAPPHRSDVTNDNFTYAIWTGHSFSSTAAVVVAIRGAPAARVLPVNPPPTPENCPRDKAHSLDETPPPPNRYGNCFVVYFSWLNAKVFSAHAEAVKSILRTISNEAADKPVMVAGYTDTSGEHYAELSKKRACAVAGALEAEGTRSASIYTFAQGISDPAVATGPGVRERLNRRVEIMIGESPPQQSAEAVQCPK